MYWTFILLVGLSATVAYQVNTKLEGLFGKRFQFAAIFGDSTSDTGNVYELTDGTWPLSPPNFHGRYGNGPNWADDLKVFLKFNYAYGSATTDNNFVLGLAKYNTTIVPGILQQVQSYVNDPIFHLLRENTVHTVWGGANDAGVKPALLAQPYLIINSLMNSVTTLLAGKAKTIIVFYQPPFQYAPANAAQNPAQLAALTNYINGLIRANVTTIQAANPQAKIYIFDTYTFIDNLYKNPPPPIIYTTVPCWIITNSTASAACPNPKEHFFADTLHFGSVVQQYLAAAVDEFFKPGFTPSATNHFIAA